MAFHKKMIELRKRYGILRDGSYKFIYADDGVVSVARFDDNESIISVFNSTEHIKNVSIPVWLAGAELKGNAVTLLKSGEKGYKTGGKVYAINNGYISMTLEPFGCIILKSE